ncbi:DUF5958 family protein [Streptomyces sp. NPDC058128]|uniref:DUF5958 family protein n=1 Tax=Streptomyces sp. NPDC058128 TaxID=3346352 RepID=UPI0036EAD8A4
MTERDIILNQLAQGLRPMSQGIEWFDTHGPKEQAEILLFLRHHCVQGRCRTWSGAEVAVQGCCVADLFVPMQLGRGAAIVWCGSHLC